MNMVVITVFAAALMLILTGLYMLVKTRQLLRVIIALELLMKAVTLLMIFGGYLSGSYALAQTFVITVMVIETLIVLITAGIAINVFRHHGDLDLKRLNKLNG